MDETSKGFYFEGKVGGQDWANVNSKECTKLKTFSICILTFPKHEYVNYLQYIPNSLDRINES